MSNTIKIIIVAVLALAIIFVVILQQTTPLNVVVQADVNSQANTNNNEKSPNSLPAVTQLKALPALIDLGAGKCIPCKMMAPILEELKAEYEGVLKVEFIDVWENPEAGKEYGIRLIPTQIFYDSSGKELFRHEGFFSKEDILAKWKELGVELDKTK